MRYRCAGGVVYSARVDHRADPDALMVTIRPLASDAPDLIGSAFAPSHQIWSAAMRARDEAAEWRRRGDDLLEAPTAVERVACYARAERIEAEAWAAYMPAFMAEMRVSAGLPPSRWGPGERAADQRGVVARRDAWEHVLSRDRVVVLCYCVVAPLPAELRCHRVLLRRDILPAMGMRDGGELR